jgi:hypothetical protein
MSKERIEDGGPRGTMNTLNHPVGARPARRVRLIEHRGRVVAYPEPHRTPVLPAGWAPLSREQQDAVLGACDAAPDCLIFKLASIWEPHCDYRVYRLTNEQWAGLSIVAKHVCDARPSEAGNRQLLGLAWDVLGALRIATDFFNWDLEAHGQSWRLSVHDAHVERT